MTTPEIIAAAKDIVLLAAAAATATAAWIGLQSWRKELRGRADFDAARNLIRATYMLRDAFEYCRSPFIFVYEFPEGYNEEKATPEERARAWEHLYQNRWPPVRDAARELRASVIEIEALWGRDAVNECKGLERRVRELRSGQEAVVRNKEDREIFLHNKSLAKKMRERVSSVSDDPDTEENGFSKEIDTAIAAIEELVKPHLRRSPNRNIGAGSGVRREETMNEAERQVLHGLYHQPYNRHYNARQILWLAGTHIPATRNWQKPDGKYHMISDGAESMDDFIPGVGIASAVALGLLQFLKDEGYITYETWGPGDFSVTLTHAGVKMARQLDTWYGRLNLRYSEHKDGVLGLLITVTVSAITALVTVWASS